MSDEISRTTEELTAPAVDTGVQLYGDAYPRIDGKGRFSFPREMIDKLGDQRDRVVVTRGGVGDARFRHLWAFPVVEWTKLLATIGQMKNSRQADLVRERILAHAQDCSIDKSGRILLNKQLREYAGIDTEEGGELVVTGMGHKVRIWWRPTFEQYEARSGYDEEVEQAIAELGI